MKRTPVVSLVLTDSYCDRLIDMQFYHIQFSLTLFMGRSFDLIRKNWMLIFLAADQDKMYT